MILLTWDNYIYSTSGTRHQFFMESMWESSWTFIWIIDIRDELFAAKNIEIHNGLVSNLAQVCHIYVSFILGHAFALVLICLLLVMRINFS